MTTIAYSNAQTLFDARKQYFDENHFGDDGGYSKKWVKLMIGPLPMAIPNTSGRVDAVRFHDLHHVLTGYNTDFAGEFEISAWELASGCADKYAAWVLNLGGMLAGAVIWPRRTWRAWVRGRRSRNLYRVPFEDALLRRTVGDARHQLGLDLATTPAHFADALSYLAFLLLGLLAVVPLYLLMAVPVLLWALVSVLMVGKLE
jgi:hypothetical protein